MHTAQASIVERLIGIGSILLAVLAVVATLALGWLAVWHAGLKDLPVCQEMMGKRRQTPEAKRRIAEEIQQIRRVHRRQPTAARSGSLGVAGLGASSAAQSTAPPARRVA